MKRCPFCAEEIHDEAIKCKHCGEMLSGGRQGGATAPRAKLTRPRGDRVFAGVCSGLARNAGMDVSLMRLLCALAIFFTGIFPGLIIYIVAALIIPNEEIMPWDR